MELTEIQKTLLELFEELDQEQQTEALEKIRGTADANKVARRMIAPQTLRVVGNRRIEETLGLPKPPPGAPNTAMDDFLGDDS